MEGFSIFLLAIGGALVALIIMYFLGRYRQGGPLDQLIAAEEARRLQNREDHARRINRRPPHEYVKIPRRVLRV